MPSGGRELAGRELVVFTQDIAPLGVSDDHVATADILEHLPGDFAGVGARVLLGHVLTAEADSRAVQQSAYRLQVHVGGTHRHRRILDLTRLGHDVLHQDPDGGDRTVHFPVAGDQALSHVHSPSPIRKRASLPFGPQ